MVPDLVFSKDLLKGNLKLMSGNQMQDVQTWVKLNAPNATSI
jgi:hypothetical protein